MSVLIKGMEMLLNCVCCFIGEHGSTCYCGRKIRNTEKLSE